MTKQAKRSENRLTEAHKVFLVQRVAQFDSPKEAAMALSVECGVSITPQSVERYDPAKRAGQSLSPHLRDLFHKTRQQFLEHLDEIPESHKAVRVRKLASGARHYERAEDYRAMAGLLEQIAKEMGEVYTNRRELTGRAGGPIQVQEMSMEQVDRELALIMAEAGIELESDVPWAAGSTTKQ